MIIKQQFTKTMEFCQRPFLWIGSVQNNAPAGTRLSLTMEPPKIPSPLRPASPGGRFFYGGAYEKD